MQLHEGASSNGRPPSPAASVGASAELDGLRLACRRQARVIDQLSAVASNLRSGAAALRAENAELRSANERIGRQGGDGAAREGGALEVCLPLDARAPGAARLVVGRLRGRVPASVLEDALLVVSELVSNSVCHSGASDGAIVVRVELTGTMVRVEVEDPGRGGVIAPRDPDLRRLRAEPRPRAVRTLGVRARGRGRHAGVGPARARVRAGIRAGVRAPGHGRSSRKRTAKQRASGARRRTPAGGDP